MLEHLIEWDQAAFGLINGTWHNDFLDVILPYWRNKKTWIPLYALLLLIIGKDRGFKTVWVLIIIGLTIGLSDQVSSQWIKKTIERIRPCNDTNLGAVRELVPCGGGYSFTSSHATNHFAFAMQLFLLFRLNWQKRYFVLLFFWAGLIAYSQVYVGVHYPLDVTMGAILGCFLAWIVYWATAWLGIIKKIWS
ncbi:phosphatase PAP2 family protein [Aureispira anguillae]|uniref:Phosphatase PAP2 family protein n=1 Tax=Aureispira anguillae TaxID=2864201 RepID=A0A915YGT6_9BACT|nr:phosphatase PAP2 family protein [Aureispira anguillae]BDS12693.1 phosphatase PAP2 family protein [Aureispira anguillae]